MIDRFADEIDQAAVISASHNEACIKSAQHAMRPQQEPDENGNYPHTECVECGDDLPIERMKMGRILCVYCQEQKERARKLHAGRYA